MCPRRSSTWFRVVASLLVPSLLGLVLHNGLAPPAWAQDSPRALFESGVDAYKISDLKRAEQQLQRAQDALRPVEGGNPDARRLLAEVSLYLGRVAVVTDRIEEAHGHFREALSRDRSLDLSMETDPPKIVEVFSQVRAKVLAELPPVPTPEPAPAAAATPAPDVQVAPAVVAAAPGPTPRPKKKKRWIWWVLGGAAVAGAAVAVLGSSGGGGDETLNLAGTWSLVRTPTSNTCGLSDVAGSSDRVTLTQNGTQLTLFFPSGLQLIGSLSGRSVSLSGNVLVALPSGCRGTGGFQITGTASRDQITGTDVLTLTLDPDTCGTAGQCRLNFSFVMTRL
jgi:hypothetical protein